jgi:hypothetical protein
VEESGAATDGLKIATKKILSILQNSINFTIYAN